ncbi:hypothetical protein OAN82_04135 [Pelagibacteraceae bacterium]|nr:hypothetical protein [Pelagibacteraceae bacterium]MDC1158201.1 hypothetical protein [Pelagibacteraceae bacterium]
MKKKTNQLISDVFFPILGIGMLIFGFVLYDNLTFIPELSFCSANSSETFIKIIQNLCGVPFLKGIVLILNTRIIFILVIYAIIIISIYFVLNRVGFKEPEEHIETKEEKEKWKKYQIYIFFITLIIVILLLTIFEI